MLYLCSKFGKQKARRDEGMDASNYPHISALAAEAAQEMSADELAFQRKRYPDLDDEAWKMLVQQVDGRIRMQRKLPELTSIQGIIFPPRINLEQCSSEVTAQYKARLIQVLGVCQLLDLTGGFGIDFLYMSRGLQTATYVERNDHLAAIVQYNLGLTGSHAHCDVFCEEAEAFLQRFAFATIGGGKRLIYLDPARRSETGGKVVRIEDCQPDVTALLPTLLAKSDCVLLKLSPMLDLTAAIRSLGRTWQTHIVAASGEVKEVLLLHDKNQTEAQITATDPTQDLLFTFTGEEEAEAQENLCTATIGEGDYLYEPHAALLKAGAFRVLCKRYGVAKLAANTHIYHSATMESAFPGRIFRVEQAYANMREMQGIQANIICRNYGMSADALKKRLHAKDGGTTYLLGATTMQATGKGQGAKPALFVCKRVK